MNLATYCAFPTIWLSDLCWHWISLQIELKYTFCPGWFHKETKQKHKRLNKFSEKRSVTLCNKTKLKNLLFSLSTCLSVFFSAHLSLSQLTSLPHVLLTQWAVWTPSFTAYPSCVSCFSLSPLPVANSLLFHCPLVDSYICARARTHTHIYIYMCVCVCVCTPMANSQPYTQLSLYIMSQC